MRKLFRHVALGVSLAVASANLPAAGHIPVADHSASMVDYTEGHPSVRARVAAFRAAKGVPLTSPNDIDRLKVPHFEQTAQAINRETVTIPVGNGPTGVGFDRRFAWVTNGPDDSVSKIDARTNEVTSTIPLNTGGFPARVAFTSGAIWISACFSDSVVRVNSRTSRIEAIIPTGVCPFGMDVFEGDLFVANADDKIVRIDPSTNEIIATIHARLEPTPDDFNFINLRVAFDSVWVSTGVSTVLRIDPSTNDVARTITLRPCCGHLGEIVAGANSLWVSGDQFANSLFRINPRSSRVIAEIPSPVEGLVAGNGYLNGLVWVISNNFGPSQLLQVDPETNTMRATPFAIGFNSFTMATGRGSLWIPSFAENAVYRISPGASDRDEDNGFHENVTVQRVR